MKAAAVTIALWTAHAQTITSCGGADDILSNPVFTLTPDPPQPGQPLTIEFSGTTTKQVVKGHSAVDLKISLLGGIVKVPVQTGATFEVAPGFQATDSSFKFGPFTVPEMPAAMGKVAVSGQVEVSDDGGKRVMCVAIDGTFGESGKEEDAAPAEVGLADWSGCGQDSDHLKNPTVTQDDTSFTFTGTLDEDVDSGAAVVDLTVGILSTSVPVQLEVPFALSPAFPAGDLMLKLTQDSAAPVTNDVPVTVTGSVKVNDGKGEEISCVASDPSVMEVQV